MTRLIKLLCFRSGLLSLYHRIRNRRTLTVVIFHRVLAPEDRRWLQADPEWTISKGLFHSCLRFFAEHYNVVSLSELEQWRAGVRALPNRALLITFDDGWADTSDYAVTALQHHRMPSVLFAIGGIFKSDVSLDPALRASRQDLLSPFHLRQLLTSGVALGAHGMTHTSLPVCTDRLTELRGSREIISTEASEPILAWSFPHGQYTTACVEDVAASGYRLIFTSEEHLNDSRISPRDAVVLGRIYIPAHEVSKNGLRLSPELLATWLFCRPRKQPE